MSVSVSEEGKEDFTWRPQPGPQTAFLHCTFADEIFFGGARGGGKALCVNEPVLTPFGWKKIGDVRVGDRLCATDGTVSSVIGVYPQGIRPLFNVVFSDGAVVKADADHNWLAWRTNKSVKKSNDRVCGERAARIVKTSQLVDWIKRGRVAIPVTEPVAMNVNRGQAIDPYVMGLLLGDGSITSRRAGIRLATADEEVAAAFMSEFPSSKRYDDSRSSVWEMRALADIDEAWRHIEKIGLAGCGSHDKFIPRCYLLAPENKRWALFQGLMDTDGWAEPGRAVFYSSSSERLARDVMELAHSLGAVCSLQTKKTSWTVRIKLRNSEDAFRLERKREIAMTIEPQVMQRYIERIEPCGEGEAVCIQVDHPNSLFITRDYVVTHNTDAAIGKLLIKALQYGKGMRGIFFRRTYKQLEEVMLRAHELFPRHGAKWKEKDMTWTFPSGAWVKFAYLERDQDADNYQGKSFTDIVIEEAGTFPDPKPIWKLKACLRSAKGIPCQMLLTGNPGGPGANWVRARYIDPAPMGWEPITEVSIRKLPNGQEEAFEATRIYIPSRVTDNQILMNNDPNYISRLMEAGSEQLVKAWLEGDFYVIDGAFFDNWDQRKHVIPAAELPDWWMRWRAADWGSAKPFCNLWMALASEDWTHPRSGHLIPKGAIVVYREWYGVKKKNDGTITPNVGIKIYAEEFAAGVLKREKKHENITFGVMDPSAFAVDGGPSIAERIFRSTNGKVSYRRADNKRTATSGALAGWDQVRGRLGGEDHFGEGKTIPMLFVMDCCHHLIRTLPMQQHDPDRPEDIDTDGEDHAVDALRYGCMARPYMRPTPTQADDRITDLSDVTLDMLWYDQDRQRKRISHKRL